jgi:hypothetical protein
MSEPQNAEEALRQIAQQVERQHRQALQEYSLSRVRRRQQRLL